MTVKETGYDGVSMQFTLETLTTGVMYKIALLVYNSEGQSQMSEYLIIGASALPVPPAQLYKES